MPASSVRTLRTLHREWKGCLKRGVQAVVGDAYIGFRDNECVLENDASGWPICDIVATAGPRQQPAGNLNVSSIFSTWFRTHHSQSRVPWLRTSFMDHILQYLSLSRQY